MTKPRLPEYVQIGPLGCQRFGLHCFTWAWQRGSYRPVAKLFLGWRLRAGVWLSRDEDNNVEVAVSLFGVHWDLVVTTWKEPTLLRAWAEALDDADA